MTNIDQTEYLVTNQTNPQANGVYKEIDKEEFDVRFPKALKTEFGNKYKKRSKKG
jgi:hypothetical protein